LQALDNQCANLSEFFVDVMLRLSMMFLLTS